MQMVNHTIESLPYDRKPAALYEPIKYVLSLGGKRLRPVLMLMAYNMYKEDVERILMPAVAIETYHNFTLLHDDLMDRAEVRRGPRLPLPRARKQLVFDRDGERLVKVHGLRRLPVQHDAVVVDGPAFATLYLRQGHAVGGA